MIKVGVFWVSAFLDIDIILDIEEYPEDYQGIAIGNCKRV